MDVRRWEKKPRKFTSPGTRVFPRSPSALPNRFRSPSDDDDECPRVSRLSIRRVRGTERFFFTNYAKVRHVRYRAIGHRRRPIRKCMWETKRSRVLLYYYSLAVGINYLTTPAARLRVRRIIFPPSPDKYTRVPTRDSFPIPFIHSPNRVLLPDVYNAFIHRSPVNGQRPA